MVLAGLAAVVLGAAAVWFGSLNQDEGWYLYAAQLVRAGKMPYHDFFFTQGPTLPMVYSLLAPLWTGGGPLHGVLGGRVVTLVFGLAGVLVFMRTSQLLVPRERRFAVGLTTFALLACNVYHLYFLAIPKTYALGSFFVAVGLYFLADGLRRDGARRALRLAASGVALAFASGTRISLVLMLGVIGFSLLFAFRRYRRSFFWFGLGGAAGLFFTYGLFTLDPASLQGLLAAQKYHAARGGFDLMFAVGSVSRLSRAYVALLALLGVVAARFVSRLAAAPRAEAAPRGGVALADHASFLMWTIVASFAAVFMLQLSAPFPYDDYQVPIMGMLAMVASVLLTATLRPADEAADFRQTAAVFLLACVASFGSPQLQQWFVAGQDRFWSLMKERSDLAGLRAAAREVEAVDPGGTTLLTQDLYLAVECGRSVPEGLEMGPFSYFPDCFDAEAEALHVMNTERMRSLLESAPCPVAAFSGYGFAIAAPSCAEVPYERQMEFWGLLHRKYMRAATIQSFGQNNTPLLVLRRK